MVQNISALYSVHPDDTRRIGNPYKGNSVYLALLTVLDAVPCLGINEKYASLSFLIEADFNAQTSITTQFP